MTNHLNAQDLAMIARNGGGLDIDGRRFSPQDLAMIARNLTQGAALIIRGTAKFDAQDLAMIARNGNGEVVFAE